MSLFRRHALTRSIDLVPPPPPPPPPGGSLFPGHVENRVLVGMASPADGNANDPGWTEAQVIIGQPIYEARRFTNSWVSTSEFNNLIGEAEQANALPVISFKVPGNDWAGVAAGDYDSDLLALFNLAVGRRTSGAGGTPEPFLCSFHHEPSGDGVLTEWAAMQTYCAWYFGGRRSGTSGGTYNAAQDCSDIMGWAPVGNGFWWRTNSAVNLQARLDAWPASLITALNANRGVVLNDFYDADYIDVVGAYTDESLRIPAPGGVRTHTRIQNFINWARTNGVNASGCGEYGTIDGPEMTACWVTMRGARDVWFIANQFNSFQNCDHEWRVIPANYPAGNPPSKESSPGSGIFFLDFGGNADSAARLAAFKTTLTESISALYTGPP